MKGEKQIMKWNYPKRDTDLNTHLREQLHLHFDPEEGAPAWIEFRNNQLDFDPRYNIEEIEDVREHFPYIEQDFFRHRDLLEFVPKSIDHKLYPHETGGSTGDPGSSTFSTETFDEMEQYWSSAMETKGIPTDATGGVLYIGPSGPHAVGRQAHSIAKILDSPFEGAFTIDLDTRWIKQLEERNATDELQQYMKHAFQQALPKLEDQNISLLYTTAPILERIPQYIDDIHGLDEQLEGILHGGAPMPRDTYRMLDEEVFSTTTIQEVYGNALAGTAMEIPTDEHYNRDVFPNSPLLHLEIHEDGEIVDYNEEGEVVFHRLTPEMLILNKPERDSAKRISPRPEFGIEWDGIRNVGEFEDYEEEATAGVY